MPPTLRPTAPVPVFRKSLNLDFGSLLKALAGGVGHTAVGSWEELGSDALDALASIGISSEPGEIAYLLVRRSMTSAIFTLLKENVALLLSDLKSDAKNIQAIVEPEYSNIVFDENFLRNPKNQPIVTHSIDQLLTWLVACGMSESSAKTIANRLPSYFCHSLHNEWRKNNKQYDALLSNIRTPFLDASSREWAWSEYSSLLEKRTQEGIFDETFSLRQIYIPLNAYYTKEQKGRDGRDTGKMGRNTQRVVVPLARELSNWLQEHNPQDVIRVVSGGPGSGKSSFARIFAAEVSQKTSTKVLFIPLHLIDPAKDLTEEIGRFVRDEGVLSANPLDPETAENNLLVIFDGLDELANQGKAAAETARAFVREVERVTNRHNLSRLRLKVILSGRELVVQENESEFRGPRQVLNVLPYKLSVQRADGNLYRDGQDVYEDPENLLSTDLRHLWWKNYGNLQGSDYSGLPEHLDRKDLEEVTAQPLLNYLIALSYTRNIVDFTRNVNLNLVYGDLVAAVHERAYEKGRSYGPVRHMTKSDFSRVLEEVGLAAWHGDGRTTTVKEIEDHCKSSGLGALLGVFKEGAQAGVTRLLAAFFFRQHGQRSSGEPTFVFTHKSFGEYLAACRIIRAIERMCREMTSRNASPDMGWDEKEALAHWIRISGPSAISPYLHNFMLNEAALRTPEEVEVWQEQLGKLFNHLLQHGLPMEQIATKSFKESLFQSRNAEESLLVAINCCSGLTKKHTKIVSSDPVAFGTWFRRIQGQRSGPESSLAAKCLSYLDLSNAKLDISDFYGADFSFSVLNGIESHYSCFGQAKLNNALLRGAVLTSSNFEGADLSYADLRGARLAESDISAAFFTNAQVEGADFSRVSLDNTHLDRRQRQKIEEKRRTQSGIRKVKAPRSTDRN